MTTPAPSPPISAGEAVAAAAIVACSNVPGAARIAAALDRLAATLTQPREEAP